MSNKVRSVTMFINSLTALVRSPQRDEGALVNATRALTSVRAEDTEFDDEAFQDAADELVTAATYQVSTGSVKGKPVRK